LELAAEFNSKNLIIHQSKWEILSLRGALIFITFLTNLLLNALTWKEVG